MYGTGFFPTDRSNIYALEEDGLFLTGTSEVALASLHMGEILEELPLRYTGFSTCFRREAGAAGKDTRGMFRVHQFNKVEMFVFVEPETLVGRARPHARPRGALPPGARPPLPRRERRRGRPRRLGREEVRHRGVVPVPGALPRGHLLLEHDRLPGPPPRHPLPRRAAASRRPHTLNGTMVTDRALLAILENFEGGVPDVLTRYGAPAQVSLLAVGHNAPSAGCRSGRTGRS